MSGWMIRGRVRMAKDVTVGNVDPGHSHTYKAGTELEMILRGQEGEPMSKAAWWSNLDIDGAYILDQDDVEVLEMHGAYYSKCDGCGESGQTLDDVDGMSVLDVDGRVQRARDAQQRDAARR